MGLHAAARVDHLGPWCQRLGGRGPLGGPVAPAEMGEVRCGGGQQGRGRGDLVEGDRSGLTVGDADPLAQHAVVVGAERQRDLERAVGVDEKDVGLGSDRADVLHLQAGGRGAVAVRDSQCGRPGRLLVVGRIGERVQRGWDPGGQQHHVGVDVRPEARLVQPTVVVDEEPVTASSGRHDDGAHRTTIAEPWHRTKRTQAGQRRRYDARRSTSQSHRGNAGPNCPGRFTCQIRPNR